jgi:hypothetical protein
MPAELQSKNRAQKSPVSFVQTRYSIRENEQIAFD